MVDEVSEDYCFICKDGGSLIVCDYPHCLKSYHVECLNVDPDVVEAEWFCRRHSCHFCSSEDSKFKCICCPYSVCQRCFGRVEFVRVKEELGLCCDCFKIAFLFENNIDEDDDGDKIDFLDRETYECLFQEYWEIMKEKECITVEDLQTATLLLKRRKRGYKDSEVEFSDGDNDDDDAIMYRNLSGVRKPGRPPIKKKLKKKRFTSWGSKELIRFLKSLGRDTADPIPQSEVCDIIYNYIGKQDLANPKKKKTISCDEKLHSLFHRKSLNRFKISDMLDKHFAENQSEEALSSDFPSDTGLRNGKTGLFSELNLHKSGPSRWSEKDKIDRYPFASIIVDNIKHVYLRRSLIVSFLQHPDTFENKVQNAIVRVRSNLNDPNASNSSFQLMIISGVERTQPSYHVQGVSTEILLIFSDTQSVRIFMLSDEEFSADECNDLRNRIDGGIIKRPRVVDLLGKANILHKDIVTHRIETDLIMLQHLIDRANEKGWRRELYEYVEKKEVLETPAERTRLLSKVPEITRDEEVEAEAVPFSMEEDADVEKRGKVCSAANQSKDSKQRGSSYSDVVPFKVVYTRQSTSIRRLSASYPIQSKHHEDSSSDDLPITFPKECSHQVSPVLVEDPSESPVLVKDSSESPVSLGKVDASFVVANELPCEGLNVLPPILKGCDTDDNEVEVVVKGRSTSSTEVIII